MAIDRNRLQGKLDAILSKDLVAIHASGTRIPKLAYPYTLAELEAWVAQVRDRLQTWLASTDNQITNAEQTLYNGLSPTNQLIADAIRAGEPYSLEGVSGTDYDRLRGIILYHFATAI